VSSDWIIEGLRKDHERAGFDCGEPTLNMFLLFQAMKQIRKLPLE